MSSQPPSGEQERATTASQPTPNSLQGQSGFLFPPTRSGQVSFDDPMEAAHKRQMEADEAAHTRKKEDEERLHEQKKELAELRQQTYGRIAALVLVIAIAVVCGLVILLPGSPASSIDKAWGALALILGGFVGFITGQATKK